MCMITGMHCSTWRFEHYSDVIMSAMVSQITLLTIVSSTVYSGADQRKHQSSASLAFVRGIHRSPVNSPHKGPVTRKMFPFDDVIMSKFDHIITSHHIITSITSTESVQLYVHSSWNGGICWFRKNLSAYAVHSHFLNKHRVIRSKATDRTILSREIIAKVSVFYK